MTVRKHALIIPADTRQVIAERMASGLLTLVRETMGVSEGQKLDKSCLTVVYDLVVELAATHKFSTRAAAFTLGFRFLSCALGLGAMPAEFVKEYARGAADGSRHDARIG